MAIRFTKASSQYLRTADLAGAFDFRAAHTITFSLYIASLAGDRQTVLLLESSLGGSQAQALHVENTGVVALEVSGSTQSGTTLSTGTWYDVAIVRESATSAKVYIDGAQSGSANTTNVSGWSATRYCYVGTWFAASWYGNFRIGNLKFHQAALTTGEIADEHASYSDIYGSAFARYRMDDATLADAVKDEGETYDFTATNAPTIESGPTIGEAVADSVSATDASAASVTAVGAVTDAASATDASSSVQESIDALADAAVGTDFSAAQVIVPKAVADAAAASDVATPIGTWLEPVSDVAIATDSVLIEEAIEVADFVAAADAAQAYGGSFAIAGSQGQAAAGRPVARVGDARHNAGIVARRDNRQQSRRH